MHEHAREVVGFCCRWCLLGLAAGMIAAAAWTNLPSLTTAADAAGAGLILPDAVWQQRRRMHMVGFVPQHLDGRVMRFLTGRASDAPGYVTAHGVRIYVRAGRPAQGSHRIYLKGFPYSLHAFQRREATWTVVSPGTAVLLVDARLADAVLPAGQAAWQRLMAAAQARGQVALFHPGPVEAFAEAGARLRPFHPRTPMVCNFKDPPEGDDSYVLRWVSESLGRARRAKGAQPAGQPWQAHRAITVITADPDLAFQAARRGFRTHLLAGAGVEVRPNRRLTRHASLAKLETFLAASPDSRQGRDSNL